MARIRWQGQEYIGDPVRLLEDGATWRFKMHQHGPRWAAGAEIDVKQGDILEMAAAETPMVRDAAAAAAEQPAGGYLIVSAEGVGHEFNSLAELEAAMAAERETLPTVAQLLAGAREDGTLVNPKPEEAA